MSSIARLELKRTIGFNGTIADGIQFQNDFTIIYGVGKIIVIHDISNNVQKFLTNGETLSSMTAMALSPNKRFIAVADKCSTIPLVTVLDVQSPKKRRLPNPASISSDRYISLSFSTDSKLLLGQTNEPDWIIVVWQFERKYLLSTLSQKIAPGCKITKTTFNPRKQHEICCTGIGIFRTYHLYEKSIVDKKQMKRENFGVFLCHTWLGSGNVAIGTDQGKVLICSGTIVKEEIIINPEDPDLSDEMSKLLDQHENTDSSLVEPIRCILATKKGFVCTWGKQTALIYELWERSYRPTKRIMLPEMTIKESIACKETHHMTEEITVLGLSITEQLLIVGTNNNQMYSCSLVETDLQKGLKVRFQYLMHQFSSEAIIQIDLCVWKPLIAVCSTNRVFLWNFQNHTCEMVKVFYEEVCSVGIHPFGILLLVGFHTRFDVYSVLLDDAVLIRQFETSHCCIQCSFSKKGHLFAIASGNHVQIYSVITFEPMLDLRGHNGKVTSIIWCREDHVLLSCGEDGALYEWNTFTGVRENENVYKKCSYLSVTADQDGGTGYVISNDQTIKEIAHSHIISSVSTETQLTDLVLSSKRMMLFAGTQQGQILSLSFPLTEKLNLNKYEAHNRKVTKIILTLDNKCLMTASEDGSLFIWKVTEQEVTQIMEQEYFLTDNILMRIPELHLKEEKIKQQEKQLVDLERYKRYQFEIEALEHERKYKEQAKKYNEEIDDLNSKLKELLHQNIVLQTKHADDIGDLHLQHLKQLEGKDQSFKEKLILEYNLYERLKIDKKEMEENYENKIKELIKEHEQNVLCVKTEYNAILEEIKNKLKIAVDENDKLKQEMEEMRIQIEDDADDEICEIRNKYTAEIQNKKNENYKLLGEIDVMQKRIAVLKNDVEIHQTGFKKKCEDERILKEDIKDLAQNIEDLKRVISQKEETISDKEKYIHELRKQKQQLDKSNFLLNFTSNENEKKLLPIQEECDTLKLQRKDLEVNLVHFEQRNKNMQCTIKTLQMRIRAIDKERMNEQMKAQNAHTQLCRYREDLTKLITNIQNPASLKKNVLSLYREQVEKTGFTPRKEEEEEVGFKEELQRQREHLENTILILKEKRDKELLLQQRKYERLVQENSDLVRQINDMRKEMHESQKKLQETPNLIAKKEDKSTDTYEM